MSSGTTRDLSWAKVKTPGQPPVAVTGAQGANLEVYARATVGGPPLRRFTVWERHWLDRLARALRVSTSPVTLQLKSREGAMWLSEPLYLAPPDYPGQAKYYFEDDATPRRNRSGDLCVSNADFIAELRQVTGPTGDIQLTPEGPKVGILPKYFHGTRARYSLSAAVDPDVLVTVLVPWGEGDRSLRAAALRWVREHDLEGRLLEVASRTGPPTSTLDEALDVVAGDVLGRRQGGWEIEIVEGDRSGERRLTVTPDAPGIVDLQITMPQIDGRTSFALSVVDRDDPRQSIIGTVVELEIKGDDFRFSELSLEGPDTPPHPTA